MDFTGLLIKMAVFIVLILIGYGAARKGTAGPEFTNTASKLLINVFMSATILKAVLNSDVSLGTAELLHVMIVMSGSILLCLLLSAAFVRLLPVGEKYGISMELISAFPNALFIALPVLEQLYGAEAVFYCSISCIPFNLAVFTYGIWRIKKGRADGSIKLKEIFSAPLVATLVSLVIFLVNRPVPKLVTELINSIAGGTMPLSMIIIGSSLGSVSLMDSFKNGRLYLCSLVRLVLSPILVWLLCGLITDNSVLLMSAVIVAASPTASLVSVLSIKYDREVVFTSQGVMQSTILSMLTIPAIVYFLA